MRHFQDKSAYEKEGQRIDRFKRGLEDKNDILFSLSIDIVILASTFVANNDMPQAERCSEMLEKLENYARHNSDQVTVEGLYRSRETVREFINNARFPRKG